MLACPALSFNIHTLAVSYTSIITQHFFFLHFYFVSVYKLCSAALSTGEKMLITPFRVLKCWFLETKQRYIEKNSSFIYLYTGLLKEAKSTWLCCDWKLVKVVKKSSTIFLLIQSVSSLESLIFSTDVLNSDLFWIKRNVFLSLSGFVFSFPTGLYRATTAIIRPTLFSSRHLLPSPSSNPHQALVVAINYST